MNSGPIYRRTLSKFALTIVTGSMALAVASGCDATVRGTVLDGFNALTNTLVDAFFQNIAAQNTDGTTTTTGA